MLIVPKWMNLRNSDELIVYDSGIQDMDDNAFREYYEKQYSEGLDKQDMEKKKVLQNLYLAKGKQLTLAGLLLFGKIRS